MIAGLSVTRPLILNEKHVRDMDAAERCFHFDVFSPRERDYSSIFEQKRIIITINNSWITRYPGWILAAVN